MKEISTWAGWDWILLIGNIVLTVLAWRAASKSKKYFEKSKCLRRLESTNVVLTEITKMLAVLTEILKTSNPDNRRGINLKKRISELGAQLDCSYNMIMRELPHDYYFDVFDQEFESVDGDNLQKYISTLIDGSAIVDDKIDSDKNLECKKKLTKIQERLKGKVSENEELLK